MSASAARRELGHPRIRAAQPTDYDACVRLFGELDGAPVLRQSGWRSEMMPTSLVVEESGQLVGHVFVQPLDDTLFISHMVVTAQSRRRGVARSLLTQVAALGRRAGFARWALNVDAANVPAVRLYQSLGFQYAYDSLLLEMEWRAVLAAPRLPLVARIVEPADDARVGAALDVLPGIFQVARARADAKLLVEDGDRQLLAAAVFGPDGYPGAHPFRVAPAAKPACAFSLLAALAPYAQRPTLTLVVEGHATVAAALVSAGAVEKIRMAHFRARLLRAGLPSAQRHPEEHEHER